MQHSSLWARSPLFESKASQSFQRLAQAPPSTEPFSASPWHTNTAFEGPADLPTALPTKQGGIDHWTGNTIFESHLAAAMAAAAPVPQGQWSGSAPFRPDSGLPGVLLSADDGPHGPVWPDDGALKPGTHAGRYSPEGQHRGGPLLQQLGATQSTGPAPGLPAGNAARQSSAAERPTHTAAEVVAPGGSPHASAVC